MFSACGVLVCKDCSTNGFYIPGKIDPVRACDPCYIKLKRENVFSVTDHSSNTHDCHLLRRASSLTPFNITKDQLLFTVNRMSVLLVSEEESTKYCTLCKESFNIFNWKVSL